MELYDVAIVGYGPVGQGLALALGRRGYRVVVFERHKALYGQARAGHIDGEVMRIFQGLGVAEELEPLISPVNRYEMVSAEWEVLQRINAGIATAGWRTNYLFYQPDVEDILDRAIRALPNVTIRQGCEVTAMTTEKGAVSITTSDRTSGAVEEHVARYLVGADGARSFVRESMGFTTTDLGLAPINFLVVDIKQHDPSASIPRMGELRQVLDPQRPRHASRWNGPQHSRTEFMLLPGESPDEMSTPERCWDLLKQYWDIDPDSGELVRHAVYTFETKLADQWRRGPIFLAGDAAHVMPPFLGQGLCSGLRDIVNLCWRLDLVLRGRCNDELLDAYETERRPHVKGIIEGSALIAEECNVVDPEAARWRDDALRARPADHSFERNLIAGTLHSASPLAGQPFLQGRVHEDGRTMLLDDILGHGWRLISYRPIPDGALEPDARHVLDALDVKVALISRGRIAHGLLDIDATYDQWFYNTGMDFALERPDHYLFGAGSFAQLSGMLFGLGALTYVQSAHVEAAR
jgi:2-polyprenyl-6-methoxyphenol hydroxylase-like FAD-dependent oxidoreductase